MSLPARIEKLEAKVVVGASPLPPVRTAADIVALLASQLEALRRDVRIDPVQRARTIASLAGIALRAMESAEGDVRLAAVERILKLRRAAAKES